MAIEKENYADVIDAYEKGVGVLEGESLTDYIKRNNIKIKEIDVDDESGIKSIDRGAPSIKLASETPEEEFNMMMESELLGEFDEWQKNNPGKTFDDFLEIKTMEMAEAKPSKEEILELLKKMQQEGMEQTVRDKEIESGTNRPKDPKEIKTIKAAGGGLAYLMGM
jgi:hypothetical protein